MIIAVQAAEEEQHRHLLHGEGHVIAAAVAGGFRKIELELGGRLDGFHQLAERRAGPEPLT